MIDIKDKTKCCGCSACVQKCPKQCISLIEDVEGFLYPKVNVRQCVDCGVCEAVCPLRNEIIKTEPVKVYAAYNKSDEVRRASSSGGVFTLLAEQVINDGGAVFGAKFNGKWEVVIDYTETKEGLAAFRGSKYVQASVGDAYKKCEQFLKENRRVLFSGTPCQIAGLKRYLGKEYDKLLLVDVVCHGVPSPMVWRKYMRELTHNNVEKIRDVKFRDKSDGWKKYRLVIDGYCETFVNEIHSENVFMKVFLTDLTLRPVCYDCPFRGVEVRQSDISIADFWGVDCIKPELDDDKGISLLILNTAKGVEAFSSLDLYAVGADVVSAQDYNGGLQDKMLENHRRDRFFSKIRKSNRVIKQMQVHVLPEWQYQEKITPLYIKVPRKVKCKIAELIQRD